MARYEIVLRKTISYLAIELAKRDVQRIIADIAELAINPRPPQSRKLSGSEKYRLRCGAYRVLYEIQDAVLIVCVVKVGHRREVYRS